jgi:hypothetical protein
MIRRMIVACALAVALTAQILAITARAADADDLAEGLRLFQQKANCQSCHGWAGDGRKMDNQMPDGANLRESKLDRAALVMVIKCGLPGTGMPAFDRLAYSDGRCFGKKQSDLTAAGIRMFDAAATLQPREVDTLTDFLLAKVVGKGALTRAACIDYWGGESEPCRELK